MISKHGGNPCLNNAKVQQKNYSILSIDMLSPKITNMASFI